MPRAVTGAADPAPLLGTWALRRWVNTAADGTQAHPFGPDVRGLIGYLPDGHFFVQIARADRAAFAAPDPFGGSLQEDAGAMKSQISYAGRFTFHGDHVLHHVAVASFPNWTGGVQRREVALEGDRLTLRALGLVLAGGPATAVLDWDREAPA
ncbi:lipocalin-like domain-containing protein [Meridianimarinicoccus roseus]|uniref:lipocalin-like domain-containing protein n=1 Tax=Meridianimarinicoccus roseus TaxID=2072018 RepID=UPI001EE681C4|nr:lipocalin-like domain-containing protein [Meridianimarinicoccus roseus]